MADWQGSGPRAWGTRALSSLQRAAASMSNDRQVGHSWEMTVTTADRARMTHVTEESRGA